MKTKTLKKVVFLGLIWPEPSTTAAGIRIMQLIHCFLEQNYQVTFASTASKTNFSEDLESLGVHTTQIQLNNPSFDAFITNSKPQVVVFDRFITEEQFGWRVAKFAPKAVRVLDTEDLHSLRVAREKALKLEIPFSVEQWKQTDLFLREIASIYRCDCSLIISNYEMQLLCNELQWKEELLHYLPFTVPPIWETKRIGKPFEERTHFITIGNGKHAPNIDAIIYLRQQIWPIIRQDLPHVEVHIYGTYLPQRINEMHQPKEGFMVNGRAANLEEVMQNARVSLASLRFGAGIKGKLLTSMQYGTPNVTTTIGAEGMSLAGMWNGSIVDSPKLFAKEAVRLYTDKQKWTTAQEHGIRILNTSFNKEVLNQEFIKKMDQLQESIEKHRAQNYIGSMLRHQTMNSTKYMSQWIELKNKNNQE